MPSLAFALTLLVTQAVAEPEPELEAPPCDPVYPFVIDMVTDSALPLTDRWQVLRDGVPLSDSQMLLWADETERARELEDEILGRGAWAYGGLGISAVGTATSSVGWFLFGQDNVNQTVSLAMGIGGALVGVAGFLVVVDAIQRPSEPFMAPTPRHRITRKEAQNFVYRLNKRFAVCRPVSESRPSK